MAHGDRSVDVFIRKLRQKLEKRSPEWEYIHTHFGVGYRFDPEASGDAVPVAPPAPSTPAASDQSSQVVHKSFTAA
jgi:DNA-binding winged helix-turn-helix (wHTH) protein